MAAGVRSYSSFSFEGSLPYGRESDPNQLVSHLADCLRRLDADSVVAIDDRVEFTSRLFSLTLRSNWNLLVPFGFGELAVHRETGCVRYRVSARQLFIAGSCLTGLMALFVIVTSIASHVIFWPHVFFVPLVWFWLIVPNLIIGLLRFRRFLNQSIKNAPKLSPPST